MKPPAVLELHINYITLAGVTGSSNSTLMLPENPTCRFGDLPCCLCFRNWLFTGFLLTTDDLLSICTLDHKDITTGVTSNIVSISKTWVSGN